jgi:hypothetical protein
MIIVSSAADPDPRSGAFLTPGSGMGIKLGSESGMNNSDHISESLETIFWVKKLKFFDADPGSGWEKSGSEMGKNPDTRWEKIRILDKHPGSATLIFLQQLIVDAKPFIFRCTNRPYPIQMQACKLVSFI